MTTERIAKVLEKLSDIAKDIGTGFFATLVLPILIESFPLLVALFGLLLALVFWTISVVFVFLEVTIYDAES